MMNVKQIPLRYREPAHAAKKIQNVKHSNANKKTTIRRQCRRIVPFYASSFYASSFFILKINLKIPASNFGLLKTTTFITLFLSPQWFFYLKKNSIDTPNPIKTTADKKSKNCAEQNIDKKMIQPNPIAIMQGGLLGFLPFPQFFINVLTCQRSISVLIFHYTLNAEIV